MVTLTNLDGRSLVSNIDQGLSVIDEAFKERREKQAQQQKQAAVQEQIDVINTSVSPEEKKAALVRLSGLNPQVANSIRQTLERGDELQLAELTRQNDEATAKALLVQGQPDFVSKMKAITQLAQEAMARGEDISSTDGARPSLLEMSNMNEDQLDLAIEKMVLEGADIKKLATVSAAPPDLGDIGGEIIKSSEISDGFVVRKQPDGTFTKTKVLETASTTGAGGKASAVTKIFDNGTTIQALPNGQTVVKGPDGQTVSGDDRIRILQQARNEELAFGRTLSGEKAAGTAAIKQSTKKFERLTEIKRSIENISQGIKLLDEGAQTGPVVSKLPSVRASSVALDNIQKSMGLDVIGDTTFGALSKGELDLALSKALPTKLKPVALRQWLVEKRDAQQKLANYLQDAAIFLGTPGNTVAGWIEAQQSLSVQAGTGQKRIKVVF